MLRSTSGLNKDSLALKEAAINREDEEATADMQQDADVVFYWDGGDYMKNDGAAWFEKKRRAGVMFVILAVIVCGSAVIACGSAVIAYCMWQCCSDSVPVLCMVITSPTPPC
jgi:hypothetical protein